MNASEYVFAHMAIGQTQDNIVGSRNVGLSNGLLHDCNNCEDAGTFEPRSSPRRQYSASDEGLSSYLACT